MNKIPFLAKLTLGLISLLCISYLLIVGQNIIAPFFLALLLALLFLPLNNFLERKLRFPRILATFFSTGIILAFLFGVSSFFSSQLSSFGNDIPHLEMRFETLFEDTQTWISNSFHIDANKQLDYLNSGLDKLLSSSGTIIGTTVGIFSSGLEFLFFCMVFFIFILSYRRILYRFIVNVFRYENQDEVKEAVSEIEKMTKKYLVGILIQMILISIMASSILAILGVKYAILLGVLTGILNVIPYVGMITSAVLACLFAFATTYPIVSLYVAIAYLVIHLIDSNLILPFVIGSKVKINALFSFLGILIGASAWGISGMFLCLPALAILKIIFEKTRGMEEWGRLLGEE